MSESFTMPQHSEETLQRSAEEVQKLEAGPPSYVEDLHITDSDELKLEKSKKEGVGDTAEAQDEDGDDNVNGVKKPGQNPG